MFKQCVVAHLCGSVQNLRSLGPGGMGSTAQKTSRSMAVMTQANWQNEVRDRDCWPAAERGVGQTRSRRGPQTKHASPKCSAAPVPHAGRCHTGCLTQAGDAV